MPRAGQLIIENMDMFNSVQPFPNDAYGYPVSPACYSDIGPEMDLLWPQSISDAKLDCFGGITRAQTFPTQSTIEHEQAYSPIPAIQITSHESSVAGSPVIKPTFDVPMVVQHLPNLHFPVFAQMDYYSDYLSPTDAPPIVSRRASLTSDASSPSSTATSNIISWTQSLNRHQQPASKACRHTTCSLSDPLTTSASELSWMLNSPRTSKYLAHYKTHVHRQYPILELPDSSSLVLSSATLKAKISSNASEPSSLHKHARLLTAAIGALHQSRHNHDVAARYMRHAIALQKADEGRLEKELFESIAGLAGALLVGLWCLMERRMEDEGREDCEAWENERLDMNPWFWNSRIVAACIDLGLSCWPSEGREYFLAQEEMYTASDSNGRKVHELCLNTFLSSWRLDEDISKRMNRPRAWHKEDVEDRMWEWVQGKDGGLKRSVWENREEVVKQERDEESGGAVGTGWLVLR
jgi:hypothetical protein